MGIRRRLFISFLVLFAVVFLTAAAVSTLLIAGAVERRLTLQAENLARLFSAHPGLAGSPAMLDRARQAFGAESVTVKPSGKNPRREGVFRASVGGGQDLVMAYSPDVISREKAEAVRPFAIVAAAGLLLVLAMGYFTAKAVARPLEELAGQARALPAGGVKAVGGGAELDHLVEALNRMLAEVRRAERLAVMGRMAAGVAHEIRNPLTSIKMTVQMLREEAPDRGPYDLLLREAERLELAAAEFAGAAVPLRKEGARLEEVVGEVLELLRPHLEHLSVRVERRFAAVPGVEVDKARIKRCMMNLVLNGAQAMPSGGVLAVELAARDGRVRFGVTDGGGGIPAGVRGRLFEPFVTTKEDGVGLGLALTKMIVEDHGGAIGFEEGKDGTTFWIELPHG